MNDSLAKYTLGGCALSVAADAPVVVQVATLAASVALGWMHYRYECKCHEKDDHPEPGQ